ncbi:unnamed protein product [Camellia sinensis]
MALNNGLRSCASKLLSSSNSFLPKSGGNQFHGRIPSGIGNLLNLIVFDIVMSFLTGPIPADIGKLSNLQGLYLQGNNFTGLPSSLVLEKMGGQSSYVPPAYIPLGQSDIEAEVVAPNDEIPVSAHPGISGAPAQWSSGICACCDDLQSLIVDSGIMKNIDYSKILKYVILQKVKVPLILISGPYGVGLLVLDLGSVLEVDSLKEKLLEKLEQFIVDLELHSREVSNSSLDHDGPITPTQFLLLSAASEASTREFMEVVRAYWVIFPDSEQQLIKLAQDLLTRGEKIHSY